MNTGKVASLTIVLLFMMSILATSGCLEEIDNDEPTDQNNNPNNGQNDAVSYTHLTLPTSDLV